jgi:hypothetical protein
MDTIEAGGGKRGKHMRNYQHRAVLNAMITTLRGSLTWTRPEGSLQSVGDLATTAGRLRANTEEFIELEKQGIRETKTLMKESSGYDQWSLQNSFGLNDQGLGKAHRAA